MDFATLLRPKTFDEIVGQEHLSSQGAPLRTLCEKGSLGHSFFYGPAGCGKTSISRVIANVMD
ncbi:MAG: recombinase RarA, partial [Sulfurimonas sp.]